MKNIYLNCVYKRNLGDDIFIKIICERYNDCNFLIPNYRKAEIIPKIKNLKNVICYLPDDSSKCEGIVSINVKNYLAEEVGKILDEEYDICVRTGYHCSPYIHEFLQTKEFGGTVRISLNYFNTTKDIDYLIGALKTL